MKIDFIHKIVNKMKNKQKQFHHKFYGSIYPPWYEQNALICNTKPKIYNKSGSIMDMFLSEISILLILLMAIVLIRLKINISYGIDLISL